MNLGRGVPGQHLSPSQPGPGVPGIKGLGAPRRGSLACQGRGATREPREARGGGPGSQAKMAVN